MSKADAVFEAIRDYVASITTRFRNEIQAQLDAFPKPEKGEQGDPGAEGAQGPQGQDGNPGMQGERGFDGREGKDGRDGRDGVDGAPGRDATQVEYLNGIDESRSYARGTHVLYRGGTIVAMRVTDPLPEGGDLAKAGWAVQTNGLFEEREESLNEGRLLKRTSIYTDGRELVREHKLDVPLYRGVYQSDRQYEAGDITTWHGSIFIAQGATQDEPESDAWRMMVKRGRDGRNFDDPKASTKPPIVRVK